MGRARNLTGTIAAPVQFLCRRLIIPLDLNQIMAVNGALLELLDPANWDDSTPGTISIAEQVALMDTLYQAYVGSDGCMIGAVFPYITAVAPTNTLPCDGSSFARADYPDLYAALNPIFIINANTFVTPDLRGLTVINTGTSPGGTTYAVNDSGGEETVTLITDNLPEHDHSATDAGHTHTEIIAVPNVTIPGELPVPVPTATPAPSVTGIGFANIAIGLTGSGVAHNNMQPYRALTYCVQAR